MPSSERRGSGAHLVLSMVGVFVALALVFSHYTGIVEIRSAELVVASVAAILLPLIFLDPIHLLLVWVLIAPMSPEREVFGMPLRYQDPLSVLLVAGVVMHKLRSHASLPPLRGHRPVFMYMLYALIVTAIGSVFLINGKTPEWPYAFKAVQLGLIAVCAGAIVTQRRHLVWICVAMVCSMAVVITQIDHSRATVLESGTRLMGRIFNEQANVLSLYLALVFAMMLGLLDRAKEPLTILLMLLIVFAAGVGVLETRSRTGVAAAAVICLLGVFMMRRKVFPIAAIALGLTAVFLRDDLVARFSGLGAVVGIEQDSSYAARLSAYGLIWWRVTLGTAPFLIGEGRGSETLSFADTQWGIELLYGGVIGVVVFAVMAFTAFGVAFRVWRRTRHDEGILGAVSLGCVMALGAAIVSTQGLTSWSAIRCAEVIFLVVGLAIACDRIFRIEHAIAQSNGDLHQPWRKVSYQIRAS